MVTWGKTDCRGPEEPGVSRSCVVLVFMCVHIFAKINCAFSGYILFCELDFSKMYLKRKMFDNMKVW